ncbi:hypothetical protein ACJX0J_010891, partial [Zea mays]
TKGLLEGDSNTKYFHLWGCRTIKLDGRLGFAFTQKGHWDIRINVYLEGLWQEVIRKKDMFLERGWLMSRTCGSQSPKLFGKKKLERQQK